MVKHSAVLAIDGAAVKLEFLRGGTIEKKMNGFRVVMESCQM
jgi:hypothetical protein